MDFPGGRRRRRGTNGNVVMFSWRFSDGLGTGNLTRATSATFDEDI